MIIFQVWKGTCQWLMRYECLKNVVVKFYSECDLIFDPLAPSQGQTLRYGVCNKWLYNDMIMFQVLRNSYLWTPRYECLKKCSKTLKSV